MKTDMEYSFETFSKKHEGYVVISPDYPVFPDQETCDAEGGETAAYQRAGEAIHRAYRYLTANARRLGLDMSRVAIIGGSAGAMAAFYAIAEHDDTYKAFINCWGGSADDSRYVRIPTDPFDSRHTGSNGSL